MERGYVIIVPEYRGRHGYGVEHHEAIGYGGYEVDDATTAYDWLVENLPHVDPERVGIMGWSHGGFITIHAITREGHPFKVGVANVPVTNLIFRLSYTWQESISEARDWAHILRREWAHCLRRARGVRSQAQRWSQSSNRSTETRLRSETV